MSVPTLAGSGRAVAGSRAVLKRGSGKPWSPTRPFRRAARLLFAHPSIDTIQQNLGRLVFFRGSSYPAGSRIDWQYEIRRIQGIVARHRTIQRMNRIGKRSPLMVASWSTALRYCIGDAVVQMTLVDEWDVQRTALFTCFGFLYASTVGYSVYNVLYPWLMRGRPYATAAIDCLTHVPFIYFPMFYVCKSFAFTPITQWAKHPLQIADDGLGQWRGNLKGDFVTGTMFWLPMHAVNFRLVPLHFRLPFMAAIGLFWAAILSTRSGGRQEDV